MEGPVQETPIQVLLLVPNSEMSATQAHITNEVVDVALLAFLLELLLNLLLVLKKYLFHGEEGEELEGALHISQLDYQQILCTQ